MYTVRGGGSVQQHFFRLRLNHVHHGTKLTHALLGSVADKVLRSAPVPVLMIRLPEESREKARAAADPAGAAR